MGKHQSSVLFGLQEYDNEKDNGFSKLLTQHKGATCSDIFIPKTTKYSQYQSQFDSLILSLCVYISNKIKSMLFHFKELLGNQFSNFEI